MTNKKKKPTTRVIVSPEEAEREKVAQKLAAQGTKAFGDPNQKFDLGQDMKEMASVGMSIEKTDPSLLAKKRDQEIAALAAAGFGASKPQEAPSPQQMNQEAMPPKEDKEEGEEEEEPLSDDLQTRMYQISDRLKKSTGNDKIPNGDVLWQWKQVCGDIYVILLDDKVFIYRYLKRQEWVQIQANPAWAQMRTDQQEDSIFNKCLLWPQMDTVEKAALPAGSVEMIVQQIRMQSMFLDPMYVAQNTIKL